MSRVPLTHVLNLGIAAKPGGNDLTRGRPAPRRRSGELRAGSTCGCGDGPNRCITHLHTNTPSKQQIDQTTNHTKKKNINQANTPNTQKSTAEPITHNPTIPPIPTADDQIKTAKLRDHQAGHAAQAFASAINPNPTLPILASVDQRPDTSLTCDVSHRWYGKDSHQGEDYPLHSDQVRHAGRLHANAGALAEMPQHL